MHDRHAFGLRRGVLQRLPGDTKFVYVDTEEIPKAQNEVVQLVMSVQVTWGYVVIMKRAWRMQSWRSCLTDQTDLSNVDGGVAQSDGSSVREGSADDDELAHLSDGLAELRKVSVVQVDGDGRDGRRGGRRGSRDVGRGCRLARGSAASRGGLNRGRRGGGR